MGGLPGWAEGRSKGDSDLGQDCINGKRPARELAQLGKNMKEIIEYLDHLGHALGIGGFEGVIGALVLSLAALVIVVHSFSMFRGTGIRRKQPKIQREGHIHNHLEWIEDPEKTIGWDHGSKTLDVKLVLKLCLISMVAIGIFAALSRCMR